MVAARQCSYVTDLDPTLCHHDAQEEGYRGALKVEPKCHSKPTPANVDTKLKKASVKDKASDKKKCRQKRSVEQRANGLKRLTRKLDLLAENEEAENQSPASEEEKEAKSD